MSTQRKQPKQLPAGTKLHPRPGFLLARRIRPVGQTEADRQRAKSRFTAPEWPIVAVAEPLAKGSKLRVGVTYAVDLEHRQAMRLGVDGGPTVEELWLLPEEALMAGVDFSGVDWKHQKRDFTPLELKKTGAAVVQSAAPSPGAEAAEKALPAPASTASPKAKGKARPKATGGAAPRDPEAAREQAEQAGKAARDAAAVRSAEASTEAPGAS